ncbi:MAG: PemK-like protein [Candidatus Levybacteria bacterium]|nr:PemK-like protein [Candidatus Levybacteria bacterium]
MIKRGDIWIVNLEPASHREIHKKRPSLVISRNVVHEKTTHVIVIPISSQVSDIIGPEMVLIGKKEGLEKKSVILPLFIRSIDQERLIEKIGSLTEAKLFEVEESLNLVLQLK